MSLFGTGRREGIFAVCLIGLLTSLTHLAAALRHGPLGEAAYVTILAAAVGGMLTYRFLRVQGRSRYAAFLGGVAYGMSPLFAGLVDTPREQLAAALVPLALEAAGHCDRPSTRRIWLPWAGLCIAVPFVFGVTVVATLATTLAVGMLAMTILRSGNGIDRVPLLAIFVTILIGALALTNLVWLDPLAGWLGNQQSTDPRNVLSGEATPMVVVRVVGPFLVWFALLGILRRQRHVNTSLWLMLAMVGAMPTIVLTIPGISASMPSVFTAWAVPAMSWWLSVLAITVMGAAGLDDWLDQPQRRRGAHLWLLLVTLFVAPALPLACASINLTHLATVLGTFGVVALATICWRRLGVLRFKNILSMIALAAFAIPVILQTRPERVLASPMGESVMLSWQRVADDLLAQPYQNYAGLTAAVLAGALFSIWTSLSSKTVN
tara:strand:+ start:14601 stop:15905 length:1305 start_codon:yes stop_codon:yes gene_type:complete